LSETAFLNGIVLHLQGGWALKGAAEKGHIDIVNILIANGVNLAHYVGTGR